jgi:FkbM family methyltransferase
LFRKTKIAGDAVYAIGRYTLHLPAEHPLPSFQRAHRLYDRLLRALAPEDFDGWIVDIGANIGDSAAALADGPAKKFLCIEPSPKFFSYLSKNAAIIAAGGATLRLAQVAIGFGQGDITLAEGAGTARRASAGTRVQCIPLDQLVAAHCGSDVIGFIKCDVDGYDAEALLSGTRIIERDRPILLFECDLPDRNEMACYARLVGFLLDTGYKITAFDNFGLPLCDLTDVAVFQQMLRYLQWLRDTRSTRTFYYIDCFAYPPGHSVALNALERYIDFVNRG